MRYRDTFIQSPASDAIFLLACPLIILSAVLTLVQTGLISLEAFIAFSVIYTGAHHMPGFIRAYGTREIFAANRGRLILAPILLFSALAYFETRGLRGYIVVLWFYNWYHTAMQNYGLLRIYDRKAAIPVASSVKLDFLSVLVWHFTLSELLTGDMRFELSQHFFNLSITDAGMVSATLWGVRWVGVVASVVLLVLYIRNFLAQFRSDRVLAVNKQIFLFGTYGFYLLIFHYFTKDMATSVESFYHNTQYLFFAWVMQRKLAEKQPAGAFNAAGSLFTIRNGLLAAAAYVTVVFGYGYLVGGSIKPRIGTDTLISTFNVLYAGMAFLHYYTDSFIWKARSREMTSTLGLTGAGQVLSPRSLSFSLAELTGMLLLPIAIASLATNPQNRSHQGVRDNVFLAAFSGQVLADSARWRDVAIAASDVGDGIASSAEPEASIEWYKRAVSYRPDYADAWQALGHTYTRIGDFRAAADAYEKAVALEPGFTGSLNNLGNAYAELGEFPQARTAYERALKIDPAMIDTRLNFATVLVKSGESEQARTEYERILAAKPDAIQALRGIGDSIALEERYADALPWFEKIASRTPNDADAWLSIGRLHQRLGQSAKAEEAFGRATAADAERPEPYWERGQMFLAAGRLDRAQNEFEDLRRRHPRSPEGSAGLGLVFLQNKRWNDAQKAFDEVLRLDPSFGMAHDGLATVAEAKGDPALAIMYLERAVQMGAPPETARRLRELRLRR